MSLRFLPEAITPQLLEPKMPAWRYWLSVPIIIALCTLGLLLAFPQFRVVISQGLLASLLVWGGLLGGRLLYLAYQQNSYQSEAADIADYESAWQQWAQQNKLVLAQYLLLPQGLNPTQLTLDIPPNHQQVLPFADEVKLHRPEEQIAHLLTQLAPTLKPLVNRYKIIITVLAPTTDNQLEQSVRDEWQQRFHQDLSIEQIIITNTWQLTEISKTFDEQQNGLHCYLLLADTQERYSQSIAGLVLTDEASSRQAKLAPLQQIFRPLSFLPQTNERSLTRLLSVQSPEQTITTLWLKEKADAALAEYIKAHFPAITLQDSQYFLGELGPFADFLGLMLSLINSAHQHNRQGILVRSHKGWLLSQITPIVEDDDED